MNRFWKNSGISILLVLLAFVFVGSLMRSGHVVEDVSYTRFLDMVDKGSLKSVTIDNLSGTIVATPRETTPGTRPTQVRTVAPDDPSLIATLKEARIEISGKRPDQTSWWVSLLSTVLVPILIIVGLWIFMLRQAQSGSNQAMSFGKSRAKMMLDNKPKVTFADVAGIEEAKTELQEIVEFLKTPEKFQALGARIPRGVLLVGAPGTGKTLLAKAIAGEAGVPFFSISGSDFVEMFVGVGASRVRDLFEQAKKHAPCIVFVDEIDAVGRQRGAGLGGGHDEREQTLNQLLVEMDGFEPNVSVIVIAATNRPDILDAALMRPGRFDRQVVVDQPDVRGRKAILEVHIKNKPLAEGIDLEVLAKRTPGFTGADLQNMANEAALLAARQNRKEIVMDDFEHAIDKVIAGPERRSRIIGDREKEIIAYHEVGHALVAHELPHADPVHKVTIVSRGMALGLTMTLPEEDRVLTSRSELLDRITMMFGGQVAEDIVFDEITTGASNDLERATALARRMVTEWGMSEAIGPLTFGRRTEHVFLGRDLGEDRNFSEDVAALIDREVRHIVESCHKRAREILTEHRTTLERVAQELIRRETLDAEEFKALVDGGLPPAAAADPVPTPA
ncbi:MAG: ATP-dependent zinc metalloprotease FtsH [Candidatus Sericytochromatia bacterium]|nr:ATP-dependent zinc metalloprotease FtsH [Candidatus Tanganyikabacteria bacterium]